VGLKTRSSARSTALIALCEWRNGHQFADSILQRLLSSTDLAERDRAFTTELFYGVLRNLTLLDFWIGELRDSKIDNDARELLRLGIYQLFFLRTPEHAAVYETVAIAETRARGLVNGILRETTRREPELRAKADEQSLSVRKSHPDFLIERWENNFGEQEAANLCDWNNEPARIYARINSLRIARDEFVQKYPEGNPVPDDPDFIHFNRLPTKGLDCGDCYIQDPSTAIACRLLDPKPGDKILDACAAPGGKTGYIAQLVSNEAVIVACDRDAKRITLLRKNLERLHARIAHVIEHDWDRDADGLPVSEHGPFDRILLDAPCSNTGVMRRRVDVRWRLTPADFERMSQRQMSILSNVARLLKPGGVLVYSTCSLEPEENEQLIARALQMFPDLSRIETKSIVPFRDHFDGAFAAKLVRLR
jgi:16S rRNA (cytosine967-C5)-methyltransferase